MSKMAYGAKYVIKYMIGESAPQYVVLIQAHLKQVFVAYVGGIIDYSVLGLCSMSIRLLHRSPPVGC